MVISIYSIFNWLVCFLLIATSFSIYFLSDRLTKVKWCSMLSLVTALWILAIATAISTSNRDAELLLVKLSHFLGILISMIFYYFSTKYSENRPTISVLAPVVIGPILITYLLFFSDSIVANVTYNQELGYWVWTYGSWIHILNAYFITSWTSGIMHIIRFNKTNADLTKTYNLHLVTVSFILGIIPPTILTLLLPQLGIFSLYWLGPISCLIWITLITYLAYRYKLFNIRFVTSQLLIYVLWALIFYKIPFSMKLGDIVEIWIIFIVAICISALLINALLREIRSKNDISILAKRLEIVNFQYEQLNNSLMQKVSEQTQQIQQSYDLEKSARNEIEKLVEAKNQFVMIAQHNMRTPLKNLILGFDALYMDTIKTRSGLESARNLFMRHAKRLESMFNDLLGIAKLTHSDSLLDISECNLLAIVKEIVDNYSHEIAKNQIRVSINDLANMAPGSVMVLVDRNKIYEAISVIVDNSIKYNRPNGSLSITFSLESQQIIKLSIKDSGIGIGKGGIIKASESIFYRGEEAKDVNPAGMGIGLYLVRKIIAAHHGNFSIKSRGFGHGTKVEITLPVRSNVLQTNQTCE